MNNSICHRKRVRSSLIMITLPTSKCTCARKGPLLCTAVLLRVLVTVICPQYNECTIHFLNLKLDDFNRTPLIRFSKMGVTHQGNSRFYSPFLLCVVNLSLCLLRSGRITVKCISSSKHSSCCFAYSTTGQRRSPNPYTADVLRRVDLAQRITSEIRKLF